MNNPAQKIKDLYYSGEIKYSITDVSNNCVSSTRTHINIFLLTKRKFFKNKKQLLGTVYNETIIDYKRKKSYTEYSTDSKSDLRLLSDDQVKELFNFFNDIDIRSRNISNPIKNTWLYED